MSFVRYKFHNLVLQNITYMYLNSNMNGLQVYHTRFVWKISILKIRKHI